MDSLWATSARSVPARLIACLPGVVCLLACGCNNGKQLQADLYQRELRLQEDEIYRLEDYLEEYQAIVQNYRCELAETRRKLAERKGRSTEPLDGEPTPTTTEPLPSPADSDPILDEPVIDGPIEVDTTPDMETTPTPAAEAIDTPSEAPAFGEAADEASTYEPAPLFEGGSGHQTDPPTHRLTALEAGAEPALLVTPASAPAGPPTPYPHAVASTTPRPIGLDERLALSVRPLTGEAATVVATLAEAETAALAGFEGEASVMLTETESNGRLERIARWDFTPGEVLHAWRLSKTHDGAAIELPITLPAEAPIGQRLQLWVRLVDREGNKRMQATPVWLAGEPLRIDASRTGLAAGPLRRLPTTGGEAPARFLVADGARPISEWRAAVDSSGGRHVDPALMTASFEEEAGQ